MTTLFNHKNPEDFFRDGSLARKVMDAAPEIAAYMENTNPRWHSDMARMTFYIILHDIRRLDIMPRKKNGNTTTRPAQPDTGGVPGGGKFEWLTVRLEAEDVTWLAECTDDLAAIVVPLLALSERGIGFTCKPTRKQDGFCATLLSAPSNDTPNTIGLAAYGGNVRDTCLALLYKFEHLLGGQFPTNTDAFNDTRPRFG